MKKFAASYVFCVNQEPIKGAIVITDDDGKIIQITKAINNLDQIPNVEYFNGIIVPGFVNSHSHLELAYLKNTISPQIGHYEFIKQIVHNINNLPVDIDKIQQADLVMQKNGIVAVADISNRTLTNSIKKKSSIYYHTFVEDADFFDTNTINQVIQKQKIITQNFDKISIVAHAPYTCSIDYIAQTSLASKDVYSIHNQEAPDEDLLYLKGEGQMYRLLVERQLAQNFKTTQNNTIQSYLPSIVRQDLNILLVHNIYTTLQDIEFAENLSKNIYWTLCPSSNLYIQNVKIDYQKFRQKKCKITLGTDSLASNQTLNILEEMKFFTDVPFEELLQWATINGARALKIDNTYGSIEIGKKPGLNLITNFDFRDFKLTKESKIQKLI